MKNRQKKLCVFIHYCHYALVPKYVKVYVNELSNHFDEVILVTNRRVIRTDLDKLKANVSLMLVDNEGYDLGMFYKVYQSIDPSVYSQIACVNDSNVLFNELQSVFNWGNDSMLDFWGLVDSCEKPWFSTHTNNYHIQSHFIIFNQRAISKLPAFFNSIDIQHIYQEQNPIQLRRNVINDWEIGLTQFFISAGLTCASFVNYQSFTVRAGKQINISHEFYQELIQAGYPLIKKKIITSSNWKDTLFGNNNWEQIIREYGNASWKIDAIINELNQFKHDLKNRPITKMKQKIAGIYHEFWDKEKALQV